MPDNQPVGSTVIMIPKPHTDAHAEAPFTCREWVALLQLRRRYQVGHDLWSAHEVERLRFLRWLYATNQIES